MKLRGNEFIVIPMNTIIEVPELGPNGYRLMEDLKVCTNATPVVIEVDEEGEPLE